MNLIMMIPPTGYFAARPHVLGSTNAEVEDIQRAGVVETERIKGLRAQLLVLAQKLYQAEAAGRC